MFLAWSSSISLAMIWGIWSILTLFAPLEHAHHVLHFTPDVYHCILSSSAFLFILFNSQEITMPINEHRIFTVFENPIKSLITNFGKWLIQTEGILVLCWYKKNFWWFFNPAVVEVCGLFIHSISTRVYSLFKRSSWMTFQSKISTENWIHFRSE